jgi:hypothetical protein
VTLADPVQLSVWQTAATDYLRTHLRDRTPASLQLIGVFDEKPLDGEGRVAVFEFDLPPANATAACGADSRHVVAVGETEPNFYPGYGLAADDAYSLHVGTRFILGMGVEKLPVESEPPHFRQHMQMFVRGCNPTAGVSDETCVLLLRCEDQQFAVYRVSINGRAVYYVGGDLPPGFYELTDHPPQLALRLHLGKLIRTEAAEPPPPPNRR